MNEKTIKKRILLSVTGMSPAVVTETLYALVVEKGFIPDEIRVITTENGKNKLLKALIGVQGERQEGKGALAEFITDYGDEYGFKHIHFDENCVTIIQDETAQPLADIRSVQENDLAANQIVSLVGKLCQSDETALHVSIAGGRKTMGFFMGYALSLYGREQDSLSHVLVDQSFENLEGFYYPKPYPYTLINKDGETLNAQNAKVMLAEIPWVRLGLGVPEGLINSEISYSDSVKKAQKLLEEPSLTFLSPIEDKKVMFGDTEISLAPRSYSFLLSLTLSHLQGWNYGNIYYQRGNHMVNLQVIDTYTKIYEAITAREIESNLKADLKQTLADSREGLRRSIKQAFSISNTRNHPYLPSAKNNLYSLQIKPEKIDLTDIKNELEHIGLLEKN